MKKWAVLLLLAGLIIVLAGCGEDRYRVDYCGQKERYENARDFYRAGEQVTLYYAPESDGADCMFYLDDVSIPFSFDDQGGIVVGFVMPEHDITLECDELLLSDYEP